jgi:hypothetical protein
LQSCKKPPPQSHGFGGRKGEEDTFGACIWSTEGRGRWEKEEKEGEVHGRRARRRRLGKTDLQRREHGFAEEEGTHF